MDPALADAQSSAVVKIFQEVIRIVRFCYAKMTLIKYEK